MQCPHSGMYSDLPALPEVKYRTTARSRSTSTTITMNERNTMSISRRELLKLGTGTAAHAYWPEPSPLSAMANWAGDKIPIGLQLYSVRQDCEKDLRQRARGRRQDGIRGGGIRRVLQPHRRRAARTAAEERPQVLRHAHLSSIRCKGDELKKTVEFNKTIGNQYLIVAWMPETYAESLDVGQGGGQGLQRHRGPAQGAGHVRRLSRPRRRLQEDRRRVRLGPVLCQHRRRRRRCRWTSGTAWTRAAIPSPRSNDSRAAPARSTSRNPAAPTRPWSARATSTGRKCLRSARRPAGRSGTSSSTSDRPARRWAT